MKRFRTGPVTLPALLATTLAACGQTATPPAPAVPTPSAPVAASSAPPTAAAPSDAPAVIADVATFEGFGPARFGGDEESVRLSWGRPLKLAGSDPACQQLIPDPPPVDGTLSFMLENGRLVRYDVATPRYAAPGGVRVGDSGEAVQKAYPGRVSSTPHKYVENARYLSVGAPGTGRTRLVFEVSPQGRIERWRAGLPPAVDLVEGCS